MAAAAAMAAPVVSTHDRRCGVVHDVVPAAGPTAVSDARGPVDRPGRGCEASGSLRAAPARGHRPVALERPGRLDLVQASAGVLVNPWEGGRGGGREGKGAARRGTGRAEQSMSSSGYWTEKTHNTLFVSFRRTNRENGPGHKKDAQHS